MGRVTLAQKALVRHRVDQIVEPDADAERGEALGILRVIGMLPGIAKVHVVADRDHQAAVVVVDAAPVRRLAGLALFVGEAGFEVERAGHLVTLVEVVNGVEDGVFGFDLDDGAVRENFAHAGGEDLPLVGAVKVVAHEEAAAEQVLPHGPRLLVGEVPMADLDAVEPRPVVDVVVVEIDGLLDGARLHARQPAHGGGEMAIRARVGHRPVGGAFLPASQELEAAVTAANRRIHQAGEGPFAGHAEIRRNRELFVLDARVLAERLLERVNRGDEGQNPANDGCESKHRYVQDSIGLARDCRTARPLRQRAALGVLAGLRAYAADLPRELGGRVGLLQEAGEFGAGQAVHGFELAEAARKQHRHIGRDRLDMAEGFRPVHSRHGQIEEDRAEAAAGFADDVDGRRAVGGRENQITVAAQGGGGRAAHDLFVIDDQDYPGAREILRLRIAVFAGRRGREQHREGASFSGRGGNFNRAVVGLDDAARRRQPQSPAGEFGGEERVENAERGGFIHAAAVIFDLDGEIAAGQQSVGGKAARGQGVRVDAPGGDPNRAAAAVDGFGRVQDHVQEKLLELPGIGGDRRQVLQQVHGDPDRAGNRRADHADDFANERRDFDLANVKLAFAGVRQQLAGQGRGLLPGFDDIADVAVQGVIRAHFAEHQAGVADDAGQQIVEVVRDSAGQNAEAFEFLPLLHLRLDLLARGDVGDQSDGELAAGLANEAQTDLDGEFGTVLLAPAELHAHTHRARTGRVEIVLAVFGVQMEI